MELFRVNWAVCPKCKYRYQLGQPLLEAGVPAICPKCRIEFDPWPQLELKVSKVSDSIKTPK